MKKFLVITVLALFLALPASAATTDFTADSNITVSSVSGGEVTADLLIMNGSTAESWIYSSGALTVTNPGAFKVGSSDSSVKSIKVQNASGAAIACANNTTAGTSYVTLPTTAATYTIIASTDTSCSALCSAQTGAASYYSNDGTYTLPTCGVLTCSSPYTLSAASASTSTTCNPPGISTVSSGSNSSPAATPATPATPAAPATPATPAAPATPATPAAPASAGEQIRNIVAEAATIAGRSVEQVLAAVGAMQDAKAEASASSKYTTPLVSGLKNVTAEVKTAITNFVNYGTPTTKVLGAGERAGVISSYKAAFGKVPATETEWSDVIKIGNGRWPSVKSATAETKAAVEFKKVYKRTPNMQQPNDNAAVTVISYGLRPSARNTASEKTAIKSFKAIYGHAPVSATAWDIVRAIAYSGAKR